MQSLLPNVKNIKISTSIGTPAAKLLAGLDQLLVILPHKVSAGSWRQLPEGNKLQKIFTTSEANAVPGATLRLANPRQTAVHAAKLAADHECFDELSLGRELLKAAKPAKGAHLGIWVCGFDAAEQSRITLNIAAAALAAGFALPNFKSDNKSSTSIATIKLLGLEQDIDTKRLQAEAEGNNLARWLTALPPNLLTDKTYCDLAQQLARKQGWEYKKFDIKALKKLNAGAFLAVAQGNHEDSAAILRLRYRPGKKTDKAKLSLVGKGIIFDTGGTNLKPFTSMLEMHTDMQGSAVALSTFLTISNLKLDMAVDCWLAITENRTGSKAYKSQDLITAANGKTIQTIHTDAEGRMALADTLVLASREKPGFIIDYATLTGSCVTAITTRYSGIFTNQPDLHPLLKKAGRVSGERVWPFPVEKEFMEELKSDIADVKQCSPGGGGDHILAACFLREFVDDKIPWVHVDLSASNRKGGLAHVPTEITGFGVRYTMNLLLDQKILENS